MTGAADKAESLLRPLVEAQGCELFDLEWKGGILRVSLDREGGIDVDTLGALSPPISNALDEAELFPGSYTLEVSSPGLERPLRTVAHFRRFVGTTIRVKLLADAADDADRRVEGTLTDVDDDGFSVDGRRIAHGDVDRATTVFTWGPTPKKGVPQPKKKPTKKKATMKKNSA
jgi:ribosome maturation factor RimP